MQVSYLVGSQTGHVTDFHVDAFTESRAIVAVDKVRRSILLSIFTGFHAKKVFQFFVRQFDGGGLSIVQLEIFETC